MARKNNYYVVWIGHQPGIYNSWEEAKAEIKNYPGAKYKKYESREEATEAFRSGWQPSSVKKTGSNRTTTEPTYVKNSISVDAASSGNPGRVEYQGVWTHDKSLIFHKGPFEEGTNNLGEFLALVHALALLDQKKRYDIPIYTDSRTARSWVRNKKVKTTLQRTVRNREIFELVDRAQAWVQTHEIKNQILTWDTKKWGEIPADFGRK